MTGLFAGERNLEPAVCDTGADFSPCGHYRYRLWRRLEAGLAAVWLILNPSTADAPAPIRRPIPPEAVTIQDCLEADSLNSTRTG